MTCNDDDQAVCSARDYSTRAATYLFFLAIAHVAFLPYGAVLIWVAVQVRNHRRGYRVGAVCACIALALVALFVAGILQMLLESRLFFAMATLYCCAFLPPICWLMSEGTRKAFERAQLPSWHCGNCGYDVRATPDRCPECGAIPASNVHKEAAKNAAIGTIA